MDPATLVGIQHLCTKSESSSSRVYPPRTRSVNLLSSFFGAFPKTWFFDPVGASPTPPSFAPSERLSTPLPPATGSTSRPSSRSLARSVSLPRLLSTEVSHHHQNRQFLYHRALPEQYKVVPQGGAQQHGGLASRLTGPEKSKKFEEHATSRRRWRWFLGKQGRRNLAVGLFGGMGCVVIASFAAKWIWFSDTEDEKLVKMQERVLQEGRVMGGGWSKDFWRRLDEVSKKLGDGEGAKS
eukprot:GHVS01084506.1.p1 GENE.GHVS01084506.1~~GHVS01084506.1.p1  ORF type:complete len:239 (-),score=23.18 GHVS01084506.1:52-768(-)